MSKNSLKISLLISYVSCIYTADSNKGFQFDHNYEDSGLDYNIKNAGCYPLCDSRQLLIALYEKNSSFAKNFPDKKDELIKKTPFELATIVAPYIKGKREVGERDMYFLDFDAEKPIASLHRKNPLCSHIKNTNDWL